MIRLNKDMEKESERGKREGALREIQIVENLQACQFQLVHSGLWTGLFSSLVL